MKNTFGAFAIVLACVSLAGIVRGLFIGPIDSALLGSVLMSAALMALGWDAQREEAPRKDELASMAEALSAVRRSVDYARDRAEYAEKLATEAKSLAGKATFNRP